MTTPKATEVTDKIKSMKEEGIKYTCTECDWAGPEGDLDSGKCPKCGGKVESVDKE